MQISYDYWLLAFSVLTCTIAMLISFNFVTRIYTASNEARKIMLPTLALIVGTGLWANHLLISLALHNPIEKLLSPAMSVMSWLFANVVAFFVLKAASKRDFKILSFVSTGFISSLGVLGLFYFNLASMYQSSELVFDQFFTVFSLVFATGVIAVITMLTFWIKAYHGKNKILVNIFTALLIALLILTIHFAFNSAINANNKIANTSNAFVNEKLMGTIIALSSISFFLLLFIVTLLFEKYGKELFNFSLLKLNNSAQTEANSMLDSLTNLPNRRAFELQLDSAAKRSTRTGTSFALAYIDLDHFKPINDQHGHHIGDVVLNKAAERLNTAVRGCDFVARIGGDEFVAIIEDIKSDEDITPIAERIVKSIKETFAINQLKIEISCSVGIAIFPKDGDIEKLMVCADSAMYKAKEGGRDQFRFYDAAIETASDQLLALQSELCVALEKSEFILAYQPKIDCKTQAPIGVEALIRWNHPTKGEILPHTFLAAAERFGLINEINNWVVDECCRTITLAKEVGIQLNVSINLSSHQFRNPNLIKDILKTLKFYDLAANSLSFEIKETIAINNQEQFKLMLQKFEEAGIKVALDDFGLHPISLAYLQELSVSEIKLDRSFISDITQNKNSKSLIDAVIKLAHALDLHVVAEGVETEAQRDTIVELGCDYMQGFLFAKPVTVDTLFKLYQTLQANQTQPKVDIPSKFLAADHGIITA